MKLSEVKRFEDLEVWQLAQTFALNIYRLTVLFPKNEYALVSQIKRTAVSIGANIAEGFGRYHFKEYIQFLRQARGSLMETRNYLHLSKNINYIDENGFEENLKITDKIGIKLNNLIASIQKSAKNFATNKTTNKQRIYTE